jgi:hypothetical protein
MSSKSGQFFNPAEHLVFHQDKEGNMIGGGYKVNNMLYQHKVPLFVSYNEASMTGGGSGGGDDTANGENKHFIPEKFSDLFRDLAVPAGLFMMPSLFRPRTYATCPPDADADTDADTEPKAGSGAGAGADSDSDESDESDDETNRRRPVPDDIFDTLLSLVAPKERIQHDVKTRRNKGGDVKKEKKRQNKTRRGGNRAEF